MGSVTVYYGDKLRAAYEAGVSAAILHAFGKGPKPDYDAYIARENAKPPTVRG